MNLTLSDFNSITFKSAQTTIGKTTGAIDNPAWASEIDQINMESRSGATIASTGSLTDSGSPATSNFTVTYASTTSAAPTPPQRFSGLGGWGWYSWRQTEMTVSPSSDLSTVSLNEVSQLSAGPSRPVVSQPANTILSSSFAPLGLTAWFGQGGQGSLGSSSSASALVGGAAEQLLVLPALPGVEASTPPPAEPANPSSEPLPLLPMPAPLDQTTDVGTSPEARLWAPTLEQLPPLIDQPDEERTAVAHPTNLVFGLALAGAWGLSREQASAERSRKLSKLEPRIRDVRWLNRGN